MGRFLDIVWCDFSEPKAGGTKDAETIQILTIKTLDIIGGGEILYSDG